MTQKEIDHIRKRDRWREIFADQQASGLGPTDYCLKHSLSFHQYKYWKRVVTKELLEEAAAVGVLNVPERIDGAEAIAEVAVEATATQPAHPEPEQTMYGEIDDAMRDKVVRYVLSLAKHGCVHLTADVLRNYTNLTMGKTADLMHWMENRNIIGRQSSGWKRYTRKVYITLDEWDQIGGKVLSENANAFALASELKNPTPEAPADEAIIPAPATEIVEQKNIDTQVELSVDGVVFDMEHNRLYVPGTATEKTIHVAISILKGLIPQSGDPAAVLA